MFQEIIEKLCPEENGLCVRARRAREELVFLPLSQMYGYEAPRKHIEALLSFSDAIGLQLARDFFGNGLMIGFNSAFDGRHFDTFDLRLIRTNDFHTDFFTERAPRFTADNISFSFCTLSEKECPFLSEHLKRSGAKHISLADVSLGNEETQSGTVPARADGARHGKSKQKRIKRRTAATSLI